MTPRLSPGLAVPQGLAGPAYDRTRVARGIVHLGVGAFHRSHQAEFTDDVLTREPGPWAITGVNICPPELQSSLGVQGGLYTRLTCDGDQIEGRIIGSITRVVDSQSDPAPALATLADPAVRVVTMTVTEKGYCHRPATGEPDWDNPALQADAAAPETPRSLPGLLVRALEMRRAAGAAPPTLLSCDNIPSNGRILKGVVTGLAARRDEKLAAWIESAVAFPQSMVDRIAPAVSEADRSRVEHLYGYRDEAAVVCEPFRQWVIEDRFAGPVPAWDAVGAQIVPDVEPFEILKMRVLNGAQTTLSSLGALCGLTYTSDDMADPVLSAFVERVLVEETLPTLSAPAATDVRAYVAQSLDRLRNTAIRHRNHQIATDASQKIVQRILNPMSERLRRGQSVALLAVSVAGFMAYLIRGARRHGAAWQPDDPIATEVGRIAEATGDVESLVAGIGGLTSIFRPDLASHAVFRAEVTQALGGLLGPDPRGFIATRCRDRALLP
jgi:fructuronate reductase